MVFMKLLFLLFDCVVLFMNSNCWVIIVNNSKYWKLTLWNDLLVFGDIQLSRE